MTALVPTELPPFDMLSARCRSAFIVILKASITGCTGRREDTLLLHLVDDQVRTSYRRPFDGLVCKYRTVSSVHPMTEMQWQCGEDSPSQSSGCASWSHN
jgi:hypothetical protein